jgi:cysteine synthase A
MPDSVSVERRKLVEHYGAEVILVHDNGNIGLCIEECLNLAIKMKNEDSRVFVPQQFENPANPSVQRNVTGVELINQVGKEIHGFCSGIGTGGTITGIGEAIKEKYPLVTIWAVEPENAAILSGGSIGTHVQMGIGDGLIPDILNRDIITEVCIVKDEEALQTSRDLALKEGILCGISSGTNVAAAIKLAKKLGEGKTVVTVLPDTAERYFSTPLFE